MERTRIDKPTLLLLPKVRPAIAETQKKHGTLLYIGNPCDRSFKALAFEAITVAANYSRAKKLLKTAFNAQKVVPGLIIINLPHEKPRLENFANFLKKNLWSAAIPVMYNVHALTQRQLIEISQLQLVDDIVDIGLFAAELKQKAAFLQKAKKFLNEDTALENGKMKAELKKKNEYNVNFFVRRLLDILIASILLFILSPLMILIMILIKIESKGPVIYKSKRAGKGCQIFNFYKFRTMINGAHNSMEALVSQNLYNKGDQKPLFFKTLNDPRVTKVGSFLRNTSLDELPQLINVIIGNMSLVGNRPLPIYEASTLTTDVWAERFMAPAGMTGLWQVQKRGRKDVSIEERLNLDISYARCNSIGRDLWILANTPKALFQKDNV